MANNAEIKITLDAKKAERAAKKAADKMKASEKKVGGAGGKATGRRGLPRDGGSSGGGRKGAAALARGGSAARGALGTAASVTAAVVGGIAIQQAVGKALSDGALLTAALLRQGVLKDAILSVLPGITPDLVGKITTSSQFLQFQTDQLNTFADDISQKFSFELLTSQTARLDVAELLGPFARAGLPSGRLAKDDGSFTENLVRAERRRKFLERQQKRRKFEGRTGVFADFVGSFFGG